MKDNNTNDKKKSLILNIISLINIIIIVWMLGTGMGYLIFGKKEKVSNEENRNLARFPKFTLSSYLSGEFTEAIADYYDDNVPQRSDYKEFIATVLLPLKGIEYGKDDITIYGSAPEKPTEAATAPATTAPAAEVTDAVTTAEAAEATEEPETEAAIQEINNDDGELTNNIVVANKRGIMLYGGGWGHELEYAQYVNEYKQQLGDGVKVWSMVIPTACSFYMPEKFKELCADEKKDLDAIRDALDGVGCIDAYSALAEHKDEHIYSRTDHHWQQLGAYYAGKAFAKAADVPYPELDSYEKVVLNGYVGSLYGYTQSAALLDNPEEFVYYNPNTELTVTRYNTSFGNPSEQALLIDPINLASSSYYLVFGTDENITHVQTECHNGRTLVIFKDSYGNALMPLLTSSFENIYLCDMRYFDINAADFIKNAGATDVLFTMCTFSAMGGNHYCINNNLYK